MSKLTNKYFFSFFFFLLNHSSFSPLIVQMRGIWKKHKIVPIQTACLTFLSVETMAQESWHGPESHPEISSGTQKHCWVNKLFCTQLSLGPNTAQPGSSLHVNSLITECLPVYTSLSTRNTCWDYSAKELVYQKAHRPPELTWHYWVLIFKPSICSVAGIAKSMRYDNRGWFGI